jgi:hypothetical protein
VLGGFGKEAAQRLPGVGGRVARDLLRRSHDHDVPAGIPTLRT